MDTEQRGMTKTDDYIMWKTIMLTKPIAMKNVPYDVIQNLTKKVI